MITNSLKDKNDVPYDMLQARLNERGYFIYIYLSNLIILDIHINSVISLKNMLLDE